jgi:hypothetical protein
MSYLGGPPEVGPLGSPNERVCPNCQCHPTWSFRHRRDYRVEKGLELRRSMKYRASEKMIKVPKSNFRARRSDKRSVINITDLLFGVLLYWCVDG